MYKFLSYYIEKFEKLKQNVTLDGPEPHKPILLLAIIAQMSINPFQENYFKKKDLLEYFEKIWNQLVITKHKVDIDASFKYLHSESFWHSNEINCASLDPELYYYLQVEQGRKTLANILLKFLSEDDNSWEKILQIFDCQNNTVEFNSINGKEIQKDGELSYTQKNNLSKTDVFLDKNNHNDIDDLHRISICQNEDNLDDLCLTPVCKKALIKIGVNTSSEFQNFNINRLFKKLDNNISEIQCLKDAQKKLQGFFYQHVNVEFLQHPLRDVVKFDSFYRFIGDIPFEYSVKNVLKGFAFFEFDPIDILLSTTLEYFVLHLPYRIFSDFWNTIEQKGNVSNQSFVITNEKNIINNKYKVCFTKSLFNNTTIEILYKNMIFTLHDYNEYIHCLHKLNANTISIAFLHTNIYYLLCQFQQNLNIFSGGQIINKMLRHQDERTISIVKKRIGEKQTLENVSSVFNLTRERVRQISKSLDDMIIVNKEEWPLPVYYPTNALYIFCDSLFCMNGGVLEINKLREYFNDFIDSDEDYNFIVYFIKLNFSLSQFKDCIYLNNYNCLKCEKIKNIFLTQISEKKIINYDQICLIIRGICVNCKDGICPVFKQFIPVFFHINLREISIYDIEDKCLYSIEEYYLRKGSSKNIFDFLFAKQSVMTFEEIHKKLLNYRPDITERSTYSYIQHANIVLADRGKYMPKNLLPKLTFDLYKKIIDKIVAKLQKNANSLLSLIIIFKQFQTQLIEQKCTTPYMLFEILKEMNPSGIRFIKCPYVTTIANKDNFSISSLLEEYICENGKTALNDVREYFCSELGISKPVFTISYTRAEKLIVDDENNLIHINDLNISLENLKNFVSCLDALSDTETITARKIFIENKASCLLLDITGPKMLFYILRYFLGNKFSFKYPKISKNSENIVAFHQQIVEYIRDSKSFCTKEQLEDYCNKEHLSCRNLYITSETYPELFSYLPGTWVHTETIGYNPQWIEQITQIAKKVLDNSIEPKKSYSRIEFIFEFEDELPKLASDELFWTNTLIGEILDKSNDFIVYGKNHLFFSSKNDGNNINNFGDLCAILLDEEFDGAANLQEFSSYLRSKELISNAELHNSILQGSKRIVIDGMEIYTKREQ